jgi:FkbM family methyltransferase
MYDPVVTTSKGARMMSAMRRMIGTVVRETFPPVLLRGVKAVRRAIQADKPMRIPGSEVYVTHRGRDEDVELFDQIVLKGAYNFQRTSRAWGINKFYNATPKPLIIDCGANIGVASLDFAVRFPKATVIAIEPEMSNFEVLKKNIAGQPNMIAVHGAIAAEPGELPVFDPGLGTAGYRTTGGAEERPIGSVRAYTLDELFAMVPGATPFVVKIDIEGFEQELFAKHPKMLMQCPIVILELHDWFRTGSSQNFLRWHVSSDRDLEHTGDNVFSFDNSAIVRVVGHPERPA